MNNDFSVKSHYTLTRMTEDELRSDSSRIVCNSDQGIQTAIMADDGKTVRSVVGLGCIRYLPDPDPDPLDDILQMLLDSTEENKL